MGLLQARVNLVDVLEHAFQAVVGRGGPAKARVNASAEDASTLMGTVLSLILTVKPLRLCSSDQLSTSQCAPVDLQSSPTGRCCCRVSWHITRQAILSLGTYTIREWMKDEFPANKAGEVSVTPLLKAKASGVSTRISTTWGQCISAHTIQHPSLQSWLLKEFVVHGCSACSAFAAQAVQHREAAQLLADQGLTGCLLAMAAWMVALTAEVPLPPSIWHTKAPDGIHECTCSIVQLPHTIICTPLHVLLPSRHSSPLSEASHGFIGPGILDRGSTRGRTADDLNEWYIDGSVTYHDSEIQYLIQWRDIDDEEIPPIT